MKSHDFNEVGYLKQFIYRRRLASIVSLQKNLFETKIKKLQKTIFISTNKWWWQFDSKGNRCSKFVWTYIYQQDS